MIELCLSAGAQPEIFQGKGEGMFVERGYFDKDFVKNTIKGGPGWKPLGVFSPRYS